ncbi:hypothetical protein CAF53_25870 (plasmid) [Sphingobium sp. LB126]|uniref:hydantoinase B/oxoprolinase family protein n=1 Tax=Sphingobium sp. LB126 TaxID=1983755 RepID=UPI000C20409A|nr:hydantoinase B/oxoprolinase family protein [Sphingobium sp. LB126]PJG45050.1 hypothetical protein CAF53_25870 [Sphingobium sp. LB126]
MTGVGQIDPVTFEIIRHRLWRITEEQAKIVVRMSGSPITYEAKDFSTGILTAAGDGLFISTYQPLIGVTLCSVAQAVIDQFGADIAPGDMFFCNDPWLGGVGHPNDQALVGPIHHDGQIIAWAGVALHDGDVGATVPGVHPAAPDSRHEGPLIPPVRIIERGVLRRDLEQWAMRTVRDPAANSLHLRCRMAAITNSQKQIGEIVEQHGVDTYLAFTDAYVAAMSKALRERLRELPDGSWQEEILIDHDGVSPSALARVHCRLVKNGERLTLDFRETDRPAAGPVNCAPKGLHASVYAAVMSMLCYDTGWCPAALDESVEIVTRPNTIVTAEYPTPVGLATVAAMSTAGAIVRSCVSKMFACSPAYRDRSRAFSGMAGTGSLIWGIGQDGKPKQTLGSFVLSRGAGAYCTMDGEDAGGYAGLPAASIYNIETVEQANPVLVTLYRKEAPETAGAGAFRGGAGMEIAFALRPGFDRLHVNWGSMGFHHPHTKGLFGGLPGSVAGVQVLRNSDVAKRLESGQVPADRSEMGFDAIEQVEAKTVDKQLGSADVLLAWVEGGGGYGDPLDRDPVRVLCDTRASRCSLDQARSIYGVVFDADGIDIDIPATKRLREDLRRARLGGAAVAQASAPGENGAAVAIGMGLVMTRCADIPVIACARCRHVYGPTDRNPKLGAVSNALPFTDGSNYNQYAFDRGEVVLREFDCPSCGTRSATELRKTGEGLLHDFELSAESCSALLEGRAAAAS